MKKLFLKSMLLLCALIVGSGSVWADDTYTLGWGSASGDDGTYTNFEAVSGEVSNIVSFTTAKNSSSSNPAYNSTSKELRLYYNSKGNGGSITLTPASGVTITGFVMTTSTTPSVKYKVDGGTATSVTASSSTYTVSDISATTSLEIQNVNTSNTQLRIKTIKITYTTSGSSTSNPSISLGTTSVNASETAVATTSIEVTYNNLTNYDADVIFYESDGTTAATYDHSWMTAEINSTTKNLDYSITANTGASRTAYLKVYASGDEGEVESGLITITQAAKSVTKPTFNLEGGSYMQGTNITISSEGNTIYYNMTTDGSTPATPTNASTEYTAPIVLGTGTTKITAIAYDTYGNASSTTTRTYTGIALASLPFSWTGTKDAGKEGLAAETGVTVSLGSNYADSNAPYRLKFDGVGKNVTIYTNEKPEMVYFTAKLFNAASTGSKIKVQGSPDGITFEDIEEFTIKGSANATFEFSTSNAFAATHRVVKLTMSSKDQNVAVGTITVAPVSVPVSISAAGLATFASDVALDFTSTDGIEAYIAKENGSKIELTKVNKVPAGTGVLLRSVSGEAKAADVPVATTADDVTGNIFVRGTGADVESGTGPYNYVLGKHNGVVGFYKAGGMVVAVDKAYLQTTIDTSARLDINFDETTGIQQVESTKVNAEGYYNLNGQRVAQPTKGLYIVNGKKVVIK